MASFLNTLRVNFLYVDKYTFGRTWVYPEETIPYGMLRYILQGSAVFSINEKAFTVQQNDVVYIPEGCRLSCRALEDNFSFISIRFNLSLHMEQEEILTGFFGVSLVTHCETNREKILECFYQVLQNAISKSPAKIFAIHGNLELILACLSEHGETGTQDSEIPYTVYDVDAIRHRAMKSNIITDPRIQTVMDYLAHHPTESLQTEQLCGIANMSETSLRRNFKKHTGKTLGDFLKELRMVTAARKLLVTDERISTIAYELGFEDANYFSRRFKETYGVSPQQYRKSAN